MTVGGVLPNDATIIVIIWPYYTFDFTVIFNIIITAARYTFHGISGERYYKNAIHLKNTLTAEKNYA